MAEQQQTRYWNIKLAYTSYYKGSRGHSDKVYNVGVTTTGYPSQGELLLAAMSKAGLHDSYKIRYFGKLPRVEEWTEARFMAFHRPEPDDKGDSTGDEKESDATATADHVQ